MIEVATYAGEANTIVFIEPDNVNVKSDNEELLDWVNNGNVISPYIEPVGEAKISKKNEASNYAKDLIQDAYSNPVQGTTTDPAYYKERIAIRRNKKADKLAGEIVLTQDEKDEAKTDQKLSEFENKIWVDYDKVSANIDKLDTTAEVIAFDISAQNWNIWTPPV